MAKDIAINVSRLSKHFVLPHEKTNSLKGVFVGLFSGSKKTYETQGALTNISFDVKKGEFFGIVGRNGSGKSTLLKILAGIYQPSKGTVSVSGKLVPFIELGVGFNPELSGRENVYLNGALLGFDRKYIADKYERIVEFAELERFMDQKLKNYSSGMQVRLAFSVATILAESDILLIDEVLAVGDADFQRKCFDYFRMLKKQKKTVIFVSHDMNAVREYCDRAILLEDTHIVAAGETKTVATHYSRLMNENISDDEVNEQEKRWGTKEIQYSKIVVTPLKNDRITPVTIVATARANTDINEAIFGISIESDSGTIIYGTNTKIQQQIVREIKKGETCTVTWKLPNIFNSGRYYVNPAIISDNSTVFDWWDGAKSFYIVREDDNPFLVNPEISLDIERR